MDKLPFYRKKPFLIAGCAVFCLVLVTVVVLITKGYADTKRQKSADELAKKEAKAQTEALAEDAGADALSDAQEKAVTPQTPAPPKEEEKKEETVTAAPAPPAEQPAAEPEPQPAQTPPAEAPAETTPAANGHVVAIDAGHQARGNSEKEPIGPGASESKAKVASGTSGSVSGLQEHELNLQVSLKLKDELVSRGYQVIMIRETADVDISNAERAQIANDSGAEIFLRIHANGSDDSSVNGALTMAPTSANPYVSGIASASQELASDVLDAYCASTGFKKRTVMEVDNMSGINWCTIPVTIVEMGFMSNPEDDSQMADDTMQHQMASGIADGVDQYFSN